MLAFQGRLADAQGTPSQGNVTMGLSVYASTAGGSPCHDEMQTVLTQSGLFDVRIGATSGISGACDFDAATYLEIAVNGESLTPRLALTASAYALNTQLLDGHAWSEVVAAEAVYSCAQGGPAKDNDTECTLKLYGDPVCDYNCVLDPPAVPACPPGCIDASPLGYPYFADVRCEYTEMPGCTLIGDNGGSVTTRTCACAPASLHGHALAGGSP
jgi:hypothetical protein